MTFTIACTHILADFSYFISSPRWFLEKRKKQRIWFQSEERSYETNHNVPGTLPLKMFKGNLERIFLNVISDTYTKITYT